MRYLGVQLMLLFIAATIVGQDRLQISTRQGPETYPPAARAVRALGEVVVAVEVGADGKVITSKALSGHPVLRSSAERAAAKWTFSELVDEPRVVRKANLFFNFRDGGIESVAESEKVESNAMRISFPTQFSVEISTVTIVPRLLLLERKNGQIVPQSCPLHEREMEVEIQDRICDPDDDPPSLWDIPGYPDARNDIFASAGIAVYRGECGLQEREEVFYCSVCRKERERWLRENN